MSAATGTHTKVRFLARRASRAVNAVPDSTVDHTRGEHVDHECGLMAVPSGCVVSSVVRVSCNASSVRRARCKRILAVSAAEREADV